VSAARARRKAMTTGEPRLTETIVAPNAACVSVCEAIPAQAYCRCTVGLGRCTMPTFVDVDGALIGSLVHAPRHHEALDDALDGRGHGRARRLLHVHVVRAVADSVAKVHGAPMSQVLLELVRALQ